jgi:hypothetical protein
VDKNGTLFIHSFFNIYRSFFFYLLSAGIVLIGKIEYDFIKDFIARGEKL